MQQWNISCQENDDYHFKWNGQIKGHYSEVLFWCYLKMLITRLFKCKHLFVRKNCSQSWIIVALFLQPHVIYCNVCKAGYSGLNFCFGTWMSIRERFQLCSKELGKAMALSLHCKMLWQALRTFPIVCPFFHRSPNWYFVYLDWYFIFNSTFWFLTWYFTINFWMFSQRKAVITCEIVLHTAHSSVLSVWELSKCKFCTPNCVIERKDLV